MKNSMPVKILLITAGVIMIAWFFIPAVLTMNFHIGVLTGAGIGLLLFFYGLFFRQINTFISRLFGHIYGKVILIALAVIIAAIFTLAGACIVNMIYACTSAQASDTEDDATVLVLGCKVYRYGPSRSLILRMDAAIDYLYKHPGSSCIVCGGQGAGEPCSEAQAMFDYMTALGIEPSRIYMEETSTDTKENLANARSVISAHSLNKQTVIATNDFHVYRAISYAEDIGLESPKALPSDTLWWLFPSLTVREMYGIMEMWFLN